MLASRTITSHTRQRPKSLDFRLELPGILSGGAAKVIGTWQVTVGCLNVQGRYHSNRYHQNIDLARPSK